MHQESFLKTSRTLGTLFVHQIKHKVIKNIANQRNVFLVKVNNLKMVFRDLIRSGLLAEGLGPIA